jgi:molybdopterin/thiamine biosynthesis adenylyltransferase
MRSACVSPDIKKAVSRPLGVAQNLTEYAINVDEIYSRTVVLTGEPGVIATQNGRWCFIDALNILSHVVGNLVVALPEECSAQFRTAVGNLCSQAWSNGSIRIVNYDAGQLMEASDAVLCVGTIARPSLGWTVINSNGWLARVSSGASHLPNDLEQPNALGALMAASLGVTEIFKRIFCIPHDVAPPLDGIQFSLFDLTTSTTWIGPALPSEIMLPDTLLVGAGAIGNGIALLLSQLPLVGRVHIVDKQDYADENLGTCILMKRLGWLNQPKAKRLASWLRENSSLIVTGEKCLIESAKSGEYIANLSVDLILNGLDNVNARRETQGLWPAIIIDGGINEIGAAVVQHRLDQENLACLMCWFGSPKDEERVQQSHLAGLNTDTLADIDRPSTEDDIATAAENEREWLRTLPGEGKDNCSVISEATLSSQLGVDVDEGFRPSAPFVAAAAAALVVSEAVKALVFPDTPVVPKFQIASLFLGPEDSSIRLKMLPSASCQCVVHHELISQLHAKRR